MQYVIKSFSPAFLQLAAHGSVATKEKRRLFLNSGVYEGRASVGIGQGELRLPFWRRLRLLFSSRWHFAAYAEMDDYETFCPCSHNAGVQP